jgi:hypothetical protein
VRVGRASRRTGAAATAAALLALSGCGGDDRQDADEPSGTFRVDVRRTSFPASQRLAQQSTFEITVRNAGARTLPALAVTVDGFAERPRDGADESAPDSDPQRPVWIVDSEPAGGVTAYDNTWTAGALAPGRSATLRWRVTPVVPGRHLLTYRVAAGLNGRARAVDPHGDAPEGAVQVDVSAVPSDARVDPRTGRVERLGPGT